MPKSNIKQDNLPDHSPSAIKNDIEESEYDIPKDKILNWGLSCYESCERYSRKKCTEYQARLDNEWQGENLSWLDKKKRAVTEDRLRKACVNIEKAEFEAKKVRAKMDSNRSKKIGELREKRKVEERKEMVLSLAGDLHRFVEAVKASESVENGEDILPPYSPRG